MKNKFIFVSMAVVAISLSSCEDDNTSFIVDPGESNAVTLETSLYTHQIYYSLAANKVVATVDNNAWDLAVQTYGTDSVIVLNSGLPLMVYKTNSTDIDDQTEVDASPSWAIDPSSGDPITGVFAHWKNGEVYIVGIKDLGNPNPALQPVTAKYKVAFTQSSSGITVKWADITLETTTVKEVLLPVTSSDRPFTWFNFTLEGKALAQPPIQNSWDIVFSPYTTIVAAGPSVYFYNVKGVRTNRVANTLSYRYQAADGQTAEYYNDLFNSLNNSDIVSESLSLKADALGYNWKKTTGDVTSGSTSYVIDNTNMYFVQDNEGRQYKFRFTSFYNQSGEEGYVGFEYVLLEE
ncbi:MAG: HmuY family protein [Breznakibacter sp.]